MSYTKTTWVDNSEPPISADNLNKIEQGIYDATEGLAGKVDKVTGKGLSTNDYTDAEKTKLAGIDMTTKQDTLVSGTNIKTVNGTSLLGAGDVEVNGGVLQVDIAAFSSLPQTVSNAAITADHVVVNSVLGTPPAQTSDWTVTTSAGSLTIAGSINESTTLTLYLAIKQ